MLSPIVRDVQRQRCWKRGSGDGQRLSLYDYGTTERSFNAVERWGLTLTWTVCTAADSEEGQFCTTYLFAESVGLWKRRRSYLYARRFQACTVKKSRLCRGTFARANQADRCMNLLHCAQRSTPWLLDTRGCERKVECCSLFERYVTLPVGTWLIALEQSSRSQCGRLLRTSQSHYFVLREKKETFSVESLHPYKNSHEYSWESHEILMRKWKLSTILMRISWAFHQISWESHEIFVFTWKLERFLMRFSSFHELLVRFLMSFSWDSRESFFHVKIGTLSHENLMRMSRDSHEHFWAFSHENSEYGDWCLHWILMRFSWDSHEAEIFSRDSHESAVVSWASHEILMRFRYTGITNTNPIHPFFSSTFLCTTCYVLWSDPGCKKINNICIYIYKNLLKSDSHSLIQTFPLLVLATLLW